MVFSDNYIRLAGPIFSVISEEVQENERDD